VHAATLDQRGLDAVGSNAEVQLTSALGIIAQALAVPCELAWLTSTGEVASASAGGVSDQPGWWLRHNNGNLTMQEPPDFTVALRDRDGALLGGLAAELIAPTSAELELLDAMAGQLARLVESAVADQRRFAAYDALIELSSQLHADEINADEILALIVERSRRLIDVDVTWLGLIDDKRERVAIKVASGAITKGFVDMWIDIGHGVGGVAVEERRPVVVSDHRLYYPNSTDLVMQTLAAEGVISVLCAPMLFEGRAIGALYGGSRRVTAFTDATVSVFTALAGQAAVSIVNSRLYGALSDKNVLLERTLSLHRKLSSAALAGADMHGIALELARLIERPVVVVREGGKPRGWRYSPSSERGDSDELGCDEIARIGDSEDHVAIRAGEEQLGVIGALGQAPVSDFERNALEQGATILALEIVKERAAWEAEWRLRGELLEEILQARGQRTEGLLVRAERFGVDLDDRWSLAVLEPKGAESADLFAIARTTFSRGLGDGSVLVAKRGDRVLVALAQTTDSAATAIEQLLTKADRAGVPTIGGLSTPRTDLHVALSEAEAVLRLAREDHCNGLVKFDRLGPLRYFLNAPRTEDMRAMVRDVLGPLAGYDERRNGELLSTLRAYLHSGGHQPSAAASCHIHVSTLKYRIGRIAELLGRSVSDPSAQFELALAFSTLDLLAALGVSHAEIFFHPLA
jgi:sugar diacid utilization regulator